MRLILHLSNASLAQPSDLCGIRHLLVSCSHVLLRDYLLVVVVVFLVVLSSAFLVVEVGFEVIFAVVLTVAAGALVVVAPATELEAVVLAPDALVVRVVPDAAARVLEVTELELELELELAVPDDAVFQ